MCAPSNIMSRPRSHPAPGASDLSQLVEGESSLHRQRASTGQVGQQGAQRLGVPLSQLRRGQPDSRRREPQHGVAAAASGIQAGRGVGVGAAPSGGAKTASSPPPYPAGEVRISCCVAVCSCWLSTMGGCFRGAVGLWWCGHISTFCSLACVVVFKASRGKASSQGQGAKAD